jgi:hypothetical protein
MLRVPQDVRYGKFAPRRDLAIKLSPSCNSMRCTPFARWYQSDLLRKSRVASMRVQSISRPYIRPHNNGPHVFDRARYHEGTVKELRLPRRQAYVHTAHYVGWLAERNKFSRNYASPLLFKLLRLRLVTPIKVYAHFGGCLLDEMMTMEARAFSLTYFDFEQGLYLKDYCTLSRSSPDNILRTRFTWQLYAAMLRRIDERFRRWGGSIRTTRGGALAA